MMKSYKLENGNILMTSEMKGKMMLNLLYGMSVQKPLKDGRMMLNLLYGMSVQDHLRRKMMLNLLYGMSVQDLLRGND